MIRSLEVRPDIGEEVRLFTEDRRHHVTQIIEPALKQGCSVICDRYVYSSVAYQGARGAEIPEIIAANSSFAIKPDVVILMRSTWTLPSPEYLPDAQAAFLL